MAINRTSPSARWVRFLMVVALLAVYLPVSVPAAAVAGVTIYVDAENGDDFGSGTAEDPLMTITAGIAAADAGDTVLVAPGVYSSDTEMFPIELKSGVTLKSSAGAATTIVEGDYAWGLFDAYEVSDITIEGLTLSTGASMVGGAILLECAENVTLRSLEVTGNVGIGGAGIAAMASTVAIEDCTLSNNGWMPAEGLPGSVPAALKTAAEPSEVVGFVGGAMYAEDCTLTVSGTDFVGNGAGMIGGALAVGGCTLSVDDSTFEDNVVTGEEMFPDSVAAEFPSSSMMKSAAVYGEGLGGGIFAAESEVAVTGTEFVGNEAFFGAGMHAEPTVSFSVTDSLFAENFAFAGALSNHLSDLMGEAGLEPKMVEGAAGLVDRCVFDSNEGGPVSAVASIFTPMKVQNSLFTGNIDQGATVWFDHPDASLVNSTIVGNMTNDIVVGPGSVVNSILWGNEDGIDGIPTGKAAGGEVPKAFTSVVEQPDSWNGCTVTYTDAQEAIPGTGNISADPLFVDAQNGDFRLSGTSPALDAGTHVGAPPYDLDGLARPVDGDRDGAEEFDMGAYEYGGIDRIAGMDRYQTAVKISQSRFDKASTVVIATGRVFADGLTGAGLAGALDAPLLLSTSGRLPYVVAQEVRRLGATKAIILGGYEALSPEVNADLADLGVSVERIGGWDRYETAVMIAMRIVEETGEDFSGIVFVARGDTFPDALSVSPAAYALASPIVLVTPGEMPPSTVDVLDVFDDMEIVVAGGVQAVSPQVAEEIPGMTRIGGADRYATAAAFSRYAVTQGWSSFSQVGLATGQDFADALAGGVAMGKSGGVLLLTPRDSLNPATASVLSDYAETIDTLDIFGGPAAVSENVRAAAQDAMD